MNDNTRENEEHQHEPEPVQMANRDTALFFLKH